MIHHLFQCFDFIILYLNILQLDDRFFSLSRVPPPGNVVVDDKSFLAFREDLIFVIISLGSWRDGKVVSSGKDRQKRAY